MLILQILYSSHISKTSLLGSECYIFCLRATKCHRVKATASHKFSHYISQEAGQETKREDICFKTTVKHFSVNRGGSCFSVQVHNIVASLANNRSSVKKNCKGKWAGCRNYQRIISTVWQQKVGLGESIRGWGGEKNQAYWFLNYRQGILTKKLDIIITPAAGVEAAEATSFPRPPEAHAAQWQDDGCLHFYTSGSRPPR